MLDACALEAKTLGATVLRASGAAARGEPFAVAHALAEQLLEALPGTRRATRAPAARSRADAVRQSRARTARARSSASFTPRELAVGAPSGRA